MFHNLNRCKNKIEEDFYLGSSDKLVYLMKEFKADMHPDNISTKANPILVAKLELSSMNKFEFPRIKLSEIKGAEEMSNDEFISKMIDIVKNTITD